MPRPPRLLLSQSYYHIITRGNNKNTIFKKDADYRYFLQLMKRHKKELPFDLYHYCLMPNHVHLLVKTKKAKKFSTFMKKLNLSYFYYYKKNYGWVGHFWQDRFKSQPVGKDEYFIQCGKYIELNPVRAGIVNDPGSYQYSSYNFYAKGKSDNLITEDFVYGQLTGDLQEKQKKYRNLIIGEEITSTYVRKIWGSAGQRYNEAKKITYKLRANK